MQKFLFLVSHLSLMISAFFVIISDEMKQPVNKQDTDFLNRAYTPLHGLPAGLSRTDHNIAELHRFAANPGAFDLGKREHISGAVFAAVSEIKLSHFAVADEHNSQCRLLRIKREAGREVPAFDSPVRRKMTKR